MSDKTLRLHFPQWQGGNIGAYHFGSQLLAMLAPAANGPVATVEVAEPDGSTIPLENGIVARSTLLRQIDSAKQILKKEVPDKVVNERYGGDLAILWVDAHPDVITPEHAAHAHTMVLGNLMGDGDPEFTKRVANPIKSENGLYDMSPVEW